MKRNDPSALRWLVGSELRNFRLRGGKTLKGAAKELGCTHGKITHIEAGRNLAHPDEISKLLRFYGGGQREIDRITTLASMSDGKAWWAPWSEVIPDWLQTYVGLEGLSDSASLYEPNVVHGLLQTEDYARALTGSTVFVRPGHSERFVSFRLTRAQRLVDPQPLQLHAVLGEAALQLRVGTPEVMHAQYQHLVELAQKPNVTIQVLRPSNGPHSGIGVGPFVVLDFAQAHPIAYVEMIDGSVYIQEPDNVASYTLATRNLQHTALTPDETIAFIKSLIETLQ